MKKKIVKKAGHQEDFDKKKVFYSVYAAGLNAGLSDKDAQQAGQATAKEIEKWIKSRKEVSTGDIFQAATKYLAKKDTKVAFMYATHRDIF